MSITVSNTSTPGGEGTSQAVRFPAALDPATAPLDGRTAAEITDFARDFASEIAFWHGENKLWPSVSWGDFLPEVSDDSFAEAEADAKQRPQAALYLAFLRLYRLAQDDLNNLTDRHLRFYYQDVLGLRPRGPQPDRAHLLFALKKGAAELLVPQGTEFTTGDGLRYATSHEIFVHPVEVVHRRILAREDQSNRLVYAAEAASLDGLGTALPDDDPSWHPFGYVKDDEDPATVEYELPVARLGFAVASTTLVLKEGARTVTLKIEVPENVVAEDQADAFAELLKANLEGFLSGEEEWLPAPIPPDAPGESEDEEAPRVKVERAADSENWELSIPFQLDGEAGAVVPYDPTVLDGGFDTLAPVLKVLLKEHAPDSLAVALGTAAVEVIRLEVSASNLKDLVLENDHGRLDPSKAFPPFGPQPRQGSSFYVGAEEALTKDVKSVKLHLQWNEPPTDLKEHYRGYTARGSGGGTLVSANSDFTASLDVLREGTFKSLLPAAELFDKDDAAKEKTIDSTQQSESNLSFAGLTYTRFATLRSRPVASARLRFPFTDFQALRPLSALPPTPVLAFRSALRLPMFKLAGLRLRSNTRHGFLRLKLNKSFYHRRYPELFTQAYSEAAATDPPGTPNPPNPPYTPELASFSLDYTAESRAPLRPNSELDSEFAERDLRFFHLTPFGQREEHREIRARLGKTNSPVTLLPSLSNAGELYLGLSGLQPLQSVSLLFQVLEGSGNPLSQTPSIEWSVLCSNHWTPLDAQHVLAESTSNLLTSGVVRLLLPEETTLENTILEPGLVWIRAAIASDRSAVARLLEIQPNAAPAELQNPDEALHLESSLAPGSIAASAKPLRGLKAVDQPYSSLAGAAAESRRSFHTRTSEHLRHRGVAVTAWDFERLVLNEFSGIYLVRCLPHTEVVPDPDKPDERTLVSSPGHVTLVVVPDTRGSNVIDPLKPYVDTATIADIKAFIADLHTPFANVEVINPRFEEITLKFEAVFRSGYAPEPYRAILQEDLKKHIAPWAYRESLLPDFGGSVVRSSLIAFIEGLEYVDHISDFRLEPSAPSASAEEIQEVSGSAPDAILTSAKTHKINED